MYCNRSCNLNLHLQVNGHYMAKLDPLGLDERKMPIELDPALYGFTDKDLDRECASTRDLSHGLSFVLVCPTFRDLMRCHVATPGRVCRSQ